MDQKLFTRDKVELELARMDGAEKTHKGKWANLWLGRNGSSMLGIEHPSEAACIKYADEQLKIAKECGHDWNGDPALPWDFFVSYIPMPIGES